MQIVVVNLMNAQVPRQDWVINVPSVDTISAAVCRTIINDNHDFNSHTAKVTKTRSIFLF